MKQNILIIIYIAVFCCNLNAQQEVSLTRKGNRQYDRKSYLEAEISYRKALEAKPEMYQSSYNLAVALQQQKKTSDATDQYLRTIPLLKDSTHIAHLYHNLGNIYLTGGKLEEAIKSYKSSLLYKPTDKDTRYNLSYALSKRKEEQKQQQQNKDQQNKEEKEQKEQKDKKDNQNSSDNDQKSQDEKSDNPQNDKPGDQKSNPESKTPQPSQLNKEQLRSMLESVEARENKVQEKSKKKKEAGLLQGIEKDW